MVKNEVFKVILQASLEEQKKQTKLLEEIRDLLKQDIGNGLSPEAVKEIENQFNIPFKSTYKE